MNFTNKKIIQRSCEDSNRTTLIIKRECFLTTTAKSFIRNLVDIDIEIDV